MIDDRKIEEAKEEIYEDRFLLITFIHPGLTQFSVVGFIVGYILMICSQRKEVSNERT